MRICRLLAVSLAMLVVSATPAIAEDWPQWRGPFFNGSTTETGLPTDWSPTTNVAWVADLGGVGGSTPVICGDDVFATAQHPGTKKLWALCLNRADGSLKWKHPMGVGFANRMGNTGASPSPIADGRRAFFLFGTGELAAFDTDGKELWRRNIPKDHGKFEMLWDYGSTPLLYKGKLYLQVIHGAVRSKNPADSYLLCIDPATGKDLWKHIRPSDARSESRQAFTTPYPLEEGGRAAIVLVGGDCLTAHDLAGGKELWRSDTYNPSRGRLMRTVPSPVAADGMVIACGPKHMAMHAVNGSLSGPAKRKWTWTIKDNSPDVCTPLVWGGRFYVLDGGKKVMTCIEPKTGKILWKGDLDAPAKIETAPTGADGRIFFMSQAGEVVILEAGDAFKVLKRIRMGGEKCQSAIAAAGGQLFIRTDTKLYCIGKRN